MDNTHINWKTSKAHFGPRVQIITDFESDRRATISGYSQQDVEQILPLLTSEVIYLQPRDGTVPYFYRCKLDDEFVAEEETSSEEEEDEEEEDENEFYQTHNSLVDMTTKSALMKMTDVDALMLGTDNENLFNWFTNGISSWYRKDCFTIDAVRCQNIDTILFMQFIMTWFGGVIAGGFPCYILDLKSTFSDYDLFIPISIGCCLYGKLVHALDKRHAIAAIKLVKEHFRKCIKNWIQRYSDESNHDTIIRLKNDHKLFTIFCIGLYKFLPKRIASLVFGWTLQLFIACTSDLRKRFSPGDSYCSIRRGCIRLKNHGTSDVLDVIIQFVPYSQRHIADVRAWNAFNVLSNFHMHFTRCLISDFANFQKTVRGQFQAYRISVKRLHTLYHPSWRNYAMLKLLLGYLKQLQANRRDCEKFPGPFTYVSRSNDRLQRLCEKVSKYLEDKNVSSGMRTKRVAKLGSICLCTLLSYRDLSPLYFLSKFQYHSKSIDATVHRSIMEAIRELEEIPDMSVREQQLKSFQLRLVFTHPLFSRD